MFIRGLHEKKHAKISQVWFYLKRKGKALELFLSDVLSKYPKESHNFKNLIFMTSSLENSINILYKESQKLPCNVVHHPRVVSVYPTARLGSVYQDFPSSRQLVHLELQPISNDHLQ